MAGESVSAQTTIDASPGAVFAVLTDPTTHGEIDGTGWVCAAVDEEPITRPGQIFRMGMYHRGHPDGDYEMHNLVVDFEAGRTVSWRPGYRATSSSELQFGGWVWRYDLEEIGTDRTLVTLTYDWSAVGPAPRTYLDFPPFPDDHLSNSLEHLATLATS